MAAGDTSELKLGEYNHFFPVPTQQSLSLLMFLMQAKRSCYLEKVKGVIIGVILSPLLPAPGSHRGVLEWAESPEKSEHR